MQAMLRTIRVDLEGEFVADMNATDLLRHHDGYGVMASLIHKANDEITLCGFNRARQNVLTVCREMIEEEPVTPYRDDWMFTQLTWLYIRYMNWLVDQIDSDKINMDCVNYIHTEYLPHSRYLFTVML